MFARRFDRPLLLVKRGAKRALRPVWARLAVTPRTPTFEGGAAKVDVAPALGAVETSLLVAGHPVTLRGFDRRAWSARLSDLEIEDADPRIEVVDRAIWSPTDGCLYRPAGFRVDSSARPFGSPMRRTFPDSPEHMMVGSDLPRLPGAFLWAGPLTTHFGHFLLEGIARLWAVGRFPDLPILVTPEGPLQVPSFRTAFLRAAGIGRDRLVAVDRPCVLEQVVVPLPSLVHDGGGHTIHRELPLRVAEALDGPPTAVRPSDRPVHLSRSRLEPARRRAEAEAALERELRRTGFLVISPERLSLRRQIRLWRRHTTFTGQIGSAFHAALLAPDRRRTVVLAHEDGVPAHYATIDALCDTRATYAACLRTDPASPKQRTHRDVLLDVEAALEAIRSAGLA